MQSKNTEARCILWKKLNAIIERKGLHTFVFKGFKANGVQANWNVVHIIYGTGNPTMKMVDKKQTCFFH
jgi:hypothetical protein